VTPQDSRPPGKDWQRAVREAGPYLAMGTSLAVTVLLGLWIGHWLDKKLGTEPTFFLVGAGLGLVAAGLQFFKAVAVRRR
jgi:ATP synthase protein I